MSTDYRTYVGPYARCAVARVPVTRLQITCPNTVCKNHGEGLRTPFCDLCGTRVESLPQTGSAQAVDRWDVREEINEALAGAGGDAYWRWSESNGIHLWMPNLKMPGRRPHLEDRTDFALFEITEGQIATEILQFQITFEDALTVLRERYGADAVTLHWGIIQDYL